MPDGRRMVRFDSGIERMYTPGKDTILQRAQVSWYGCKGCFLCCRPTVRFHTIDDQLRVKGDKRLKPGDKVCHNDFGTGVVLHVDSDGRTEIQFDPQKPNQTLIPGGDPKMTKITKRSWLCPCLLGCYPDPVSYAATDGHAADETEVAIQLAQEQGLEVISNDKKLLLEAQQSPPGVPWYKKPEPLPWYKKLPGMKEEPNLSPAGSPKRAEKSVLTRSPLAQIGKRVVHPQRGPGVVAELMQDGRTLVQFDSGDQHRYNPVSMHKLVEEPSGYKATGNGNGQAEDAAAPGTTAAAAEAALEMYMNVVADEALLMEAEDIPPISHPTEHQIEMDLMSEQIENLRVELRLAVEDEDYVQAAVLQKQVRGLEAELKESKTQTPVNLEVTEEPKKKKKKKKKKKTTDAGELQIQLEMNEIGGMSSPGLESLEIDGHHETEGKKKKKKKKKNSETLEAGDQLLELDGSTQV